MFCGSTSGEDRYTPLNGRTKHQCSRRFPRLSGVSLIVYQRGMQRGGFVVGRKAK